MASSFPLLVEFVRGTRVLKVGGSDLAALWDPAIGTFVEKSDGERASLPDDQVVHHDETEGAARIGLGGMSFEGLVGDRLVFGRVLEVRPESPIERPRAASWSVDPSWVSRVEVRGRQVWPEA